MSPKVKLDRGLSDITFALLEKGNNEVALSDLRSYLVLVTENIWIGKVPLLIQSNSQMLPCCTLVLAHSNSNVSLQSDRVLGFIEQI